MSHADELARCDREIAEIQNRADFKTAPSWLLTMGMMDWETEKALITRTSHLNGEAQPNSNTEKK